ncbi:CDP-alcohol phosphatidyltransferase family protein [Neobacillus sp. OS1-33]|uniref:CDP-alcohol phosphatidyltransferase family protein n=1 Tax=Neobacillus sp. OS1-33 TaxID=3070683 RepID=UPI0027DFA110|nr:CDP-alcohol phosphatidyltransferase family protein [Neobacillus sp. OS1-33]WML27723.1 CDP-alcohol phosphatidyltransferase family protein [Neobacillus sp. OS1-33]
MLDTHGRAAVQPIISKTAHNLLKVGLSANHVTYIAFFIGIIASVLIYLGQPIVGVAVLWLSGFLDAVDGSMARQSKTSSSWGTVLDVTFDRVVEAGILVALALRHPEPNVLILFLLLAISIIFTMTIFLTVGALSEKESYKSFYYQPGLAERTEGFILFSLLVLFQSHLVFWTIIFIGVEITTGIQRLLEARKILKS